MEPRGTGCFNTHHASPQNPSMVIMARDNRKMITMVSLPLGNLDSRDLIQIDGIRTTRLDLDLADDLPR
jgi:hypothetical protein